MKIGVPKEIKTAESRVAITPAGVEAFVKNGNEVYIEKDAGIGSGIANEEYVKAGAKILSTAKEVYDVADMIMKVKEPQPSEYDYLKEGQVLFTYLHLAPDKQQTEALLKKKVIGIAYETVQLDNGALPLLTPMSEVAGRMSVTIGAYLLTNLNEGRGIVMGGSTRSRASRSSNNRWRNGRYKCSKSSCGDGGKSYNIGCKSCKTCIS